MTLKAPIKGYIVGRRFKRPETTSGGLLLPSVFLTGQTCTDTDYRLVEVREAPSDLKNIVTTGWLMLVAELDCVPIPLTYEYEDQVIPWECVKGYGPSVGELEPLRDVVFAKEDEIEQETSLGGILIPGLGRGIDRHSTVFKCGPDTKTLKVGDKIFHLQGMGLTFRQNDIKFIALSEVDVVGVEE